MVNEKSLQNLIPSKPGEARNPAGKPPGIKDRATIYRSILCTRAKNLKLPKIKELMAALGADKDITLGELIALKNSTMALYTNKLGLQAAQHVEDSGHGKLTQSTVITGADGNPLALSVNMKNEIKNEAESLSIEALKEIQEVIRKDKKKKAQANQTQQQPIPEVTMVDVAVEEKK